MTRKTGDLGADADFASAVEKRRPGVVRPNAERKRWRPGQRARGVDDVRGDFAVDRPLSVMVEHRDEPGLVFEVEVTPRGDVVGFHVRPLSFIETRSPWEPTGGEMVTYEVDDVSVPDGAEHLTARRLRALPVGEVCDAAHAVMRRRMGWNLSPATGAWQATLAKQKRPGRRGRPDRFYAEVAADYISALDDGRGVEHLAAERCLSTSQLRSLLYEARRRGLLSAAPRGKAGGTLTDKARTELEREN